MDSILKLRIEFLQYLEVIRKIDDLLTEEEVDISESNGFRYYTYIKNYLYSIVAADGFISREEYDALNALFDDYDDSYFEVSEHIEFLKDEGLLGDPTENNQFLASLMIAEKISDEINITEFLSFLRNLGVFFACVDDDFDESEVETIAEFIASLKSTYENVKNNHESSLEPEKDKQNTVLLDISKKESDISSICCISPKRPPGAV